MRLKTYIIAEAGVNHNGSLKLAKQLVDIAVEAGADAIKFQTFKTKNIVSFHAPKAEYQIKTTSSKESQLEMLKKLELSEDAHYELVMYCKQVGIDFLSTPFDEESLQFLVKEFDLPYIKIPSGEITNAPFLLEIARTGKPVILSTGMSTLGEVELALGVLAFGYTAPSTQQPSLLNFQHAHISDQGQQALKNKVTLLHCTTEYPAPFSEVNLQAMDTIRQAFGLPIGYSDHTSGIAVSIAAVALGAILIEKHFTVDKNLEGPDHKASLEPDELKMLIVSIRQVEKAMGLRIKVPTTSEILNRKIVRKSLVAAQNINVGECFNEKNVAMKRPGDGISPQYYWELMGKQADKSYNKDEKIVR